VTSRWIARGSRSRMSRTLSRPVDDAHLGLACDTDRAPCALRATGNAREVAAGLAAAVGAAVAQFAMHKAPR
jgi:hypothetical protein